MNLKNLPKPEPAAGLTAYLDEREERFALDARTRENYQRYIDSQHHESKVSYLPIKLDIENVSRCNFACNMCAVQHWPKGRRAEDMSYESFRALIDEQYGLVEIKLNGIGEPLMQGESFFRMIRYARERRIWVRITTNASLLHLRDNYQRLIDSGVNEIDISIDGIGHVFEGIRINGNYDRVVENCAKLNAYAKSVGKPSAKMWTLIQRLNVNHIEKHVPLASKLGFDHLVFSTELHGWGDETLALRNRARQASLSEERAWRLVEQGRTLGVRVAFWDVAEKFSKQAPCPWPFHRAVVTSDLRTVPCCMIGDPDKFEIGKGLSFMRAWQSDEYRAFRQAHIDGDIPNICKGCYK